MKYYFFILTIVIVVGFMFSSCESYDLDLEGNWIKILQYQNLHDNEAAIPETDTLNGSLGEEIVIRVHSQAQPGYKLIFSAKINDEIIDDLTELEIYPDLKAYFEENGVVREIYEIRIFLVQFNLGDEIKLISEIKSNSDIKVARELIMVIN